MPASVVLHGLVIVALLTYGETGADQQPQEEAINVTLSPPPEQPKPKPPLPAAKDRQPERPPEPNKQAELEEKPARPAQIEVLKPVFRFGEKDAGPGKTEEPGSSGNTSASPVARDQPLSEKRPDEPDDARNMAATDPVAASEEGATAALTQDAGEKSSDKQSGLVDTIDVQPPKTSVEVSADGRDGDITLPASAKAPEPRPEPKTSLAQVPKSGAKVRSPRGSASAAAETSQPYSGLPGVRSPRAQGATGDAIATASMAGVPRDKRAGRLCASALQQRLLESSYSPDLIPLVPLPRGNILDVPEAAFRTRTAWHALSFRCEVDADATTIKSLSYRVGAKIPRDQWTRLGLPTGE